MIHLRRSVPTIESVEVFGEREVGEHVGDLERAPHAQLGAPVFGHVRHVAAEHPHLAGRCRQRPGHAVEQRGLAGAVGPDQGAPLARRDAQRDAVDGAQATEDLGEVVDLDRRGHGGAARALAPRAYRRPTNPTIPSGAHRIVAMNTMPMTAV